MTKKWWYLLMVAVLLVPMILTACGATEEAAPEPTAVEEPGPEPTAVEEPGPEAPAAGPYENVDPSGATVLWWHQHTRERQEGLNQMVEEFNASNEWGITVQAEYAGGYGDIYDKMITAIAANDPTLLPNLTVGYANQVAKYQLSEALVDMDEFVDSPAWGLTAEEKADFFQGIFESDVSPIFGDGHFRMGFPPNRSMEMLYYNQDWLTELGYDGPPTTWAEFAEMACAATDADAGTVGYEISTDASRFSSMVFSRHGNYFLEDGSSFDFENDVVQETMAFMKDLYDQGCITDMAEAYGDQTDFGNYKVLFTIGSSSGLPYYDQAVKSGEQGEFLWGVAPLPYMDGGDQPVMNIYGASVSVPKTTPEQELAAWLFIKWYTSPEINARWARISQYFPVRDSAAALLGDYFEQDPRYKDAFDLLQYGTFEAQWCACYEEVRRAMNSAYSAILDGADIDQTLADLQQLANQSLAENTPATMTMDVLDELRAAGKIVISTDPNYAPQSFLDTNGELDGFDIDVSKEVAERLGLELEFTEPDWDMIVGGNWGGRWDLSIGSMTPTEQRSEVLWFTEPYYFTPAGFAVHKDNTTITSAADLADKKLGLGTATTYEDYLNGTLSMMGGEILYDPPAVGEIVAYTTDQEAIQDLALGDGTRLDVVMTAVPTIQTAIDEGIPIKYMGTPAFYEPLVFALDKSRGPSEKLILLLDKIIGDMRDDGTLTDLSLKWYGVDITTIVEPEEPPEVTEPPAEEEVLFVYEAPDCDYGGEFLKMEAVDELTVRFTLCAPDVAFPSKAAFSAFAIHSSDYLEETGGGGAIVDNPVGTGPYKIVEWRRGEQLIMERFDDYWGTPAIADTLVFRWSTEGAQRLVELQAGSVDGIDNPSPDDFATIEADSNLQLIRRPALNIFYLGMNNFFPPFDDERVRQAVAMGIDRQRIVDNFYPEGSEAASHFTPCSIPGGCEGEAWYDFDVDAAKALLAEAGYPDGFSTFINYRDVFRGYLPEPGLVAQDIQAQLKNNLNIDAEIVVMESGEFIDTADAGELEGFHLLGWGADYPDATNFLDFHFGAGASPQFGDGFPDIWDALTRAGSLAYQSERNPIYAEANTLIKQHVPMVPVAHGGSATAYRADVVGGQASPLSNEMFWVMDPGGRDTFVWMQNAEPIGLYCADETDGESLRPCEQMVESLLAYEINGTAVIPSLAESYEANEDLTVWTFYLRPGVKFHDGSDLDSMDVIMSWVVQWDASHPLHVGRDGSFTYWPGLFGGFLNAP